MAFDQMMDWLRARPKNRLLAALSMWTAAAALWIVSEALLRTSLDFLVAPLGIPATVAVLAGSGLAGTWFADLLDDSESGHRFWGGAGLIASSVLAMPNSISAFLDIREGFGLALPFAILGAMAGAGFSIQAIRARWRRQRTQTDVEPFI